MKEGNAKTPSKLESQPCTQVPTQPLQGQNVGLMLTECWCFTLIILELAPIEILYVRLARCYLRKHASQGSNLQPLNLKRHLSSVIPGLICTWAEHGSLVLWPSHQALLCLICMLLRFVAPVVVRRRCKPIRAVIH
jgi:hypothetical protein